MSRQPGPLQKVLNARIAAALFCALAAAWWAFDRTTKIWANGAEPGGILVADVAGLFRFELVYNTGAAWSMLEGHPFFLGVFSLAICAVILGCFAYTCRSGQSNALVTVGLAMAFGGGLGNAFDRLVSGRVIDFIRATFVDFPVFNVADIGVTCGLVLFVVGFFIAAAAEGEGGPGGGCDA